MLIITKLPNVCRPIFKLCIHFHLYISISVPLLRASLESQLVNNLPAMWKTSVRSLGWQDPLEKRKATHPSILAWRISWTEACQASLFLSISRSLLKFRSTELVKPSNRLIPCCPLPLLPSIFPSIRVFSNE